MKLFFDNIDTLDKFTRELNLHAGSLTCQHCYKQDQFVPHGFVYKNQHIEVDEKEPIGKRVICSNRYGKTGCGHTLRLYLADAVPFLNRSAIHISLFFISLINGLSIQASYQQTTHSTNDPRNAYRWLAKCKTKLSDYRTILSSRATGFTETFKSRTQRLQLLLPTITRLQETLSDSFVFHFQLTQQTSFM